MRLRSEPISDDKNEMFITGLRDTFTVRFLMVLMV